MSEFDPLIAQVAARHGVNPYLVRAIVAAESGFNPRAYRAEPKVGDASYGLMQVLYATAKWLGYTGPAEGLFDPETNLELGTRYIKHQLGRYRGDVPAAVAAYNSGTAQRRADGSFVNQTYVDRVLAFLSQFSGGGPVSPAPPATPSSAAPGELESQKAQAQIRLAMARSRTGDVGAGLETFLPAEAVPYVLAGVVAIGLVLLTRGGGDR